ncbi:hypothetical protein H0H93_009497, partial [Arthromyces matolae]
IFINDPTVLVNTGALRELDVYEHLKQGPTAHPGKEAIRPVLDSFKITGPAGEHQCITHPPLWGDFRGVREDKDGHFSTSEIASLLKRMLEAIDYVHECNVVHTDINLGNLMVPVKNVRIFEMVDISEYWEPTARKDAGNGRWIYESSQVLGGDAPMNSTFLCDFGESCYGQEAYTHIEVQPDAFRAPEVMLGVPWSYPIDIWNIGCVIWQLSQQGQLFSKFDYVHICRTSRSHLSDIVSLLGPPPKDLLARGHLSSEFFSADGDFIGYDMDMDPKPLLMYRSLADRETRFQATGDNEDRELFLTMMKKMLEWDPEKRYTAKQLLEDEWLKKHVEVTTL